MAVPLTEFSCLNVRSLLKTKAALVYLTNVCQHAIKIYFSKLLLCMILQHVLFQKTITTTMLFFIITVI